MKVLSTFSATMSFLV